MNSHPSPLRYPGGKAALADLLGQVIEENQLGPCCYVEPYAGGAGAALELLINEYVDRIIINDYDPAIYSFWKYALGNADDFIRLIQSVPLTVKEWKKQRRIYQELRQQPSFELGFATFYLNRCNRSGIIHRGGLIGGLNQTGKWGIDARFERNNLSERIALLGELAGRINVSMLDGVDVIRLAQEWQSANQHQRALCFVDPPYIERGGVLYLNDLQDEDHGELASVLAQDSGLSWIVTYDDCEPVREMYDGYQMWEFSIAYSAREKLLGDELLIASNNLRMPVSQRNRKIRW